MKFISILLCTSFVLTLSYGNVENEIKEYTDSTQILIAKSRALLFKSLNESNYRKALEIASYLDHKIDLDQYVAILKSESILLKIINEDFDVFDNYEIRHISEEKYNQKDFRSYPKRDNIYAKLVEILRERFPILLLKIKEKEYSKEELDFFEIICLWHLMEGKEDRHALNGKSNQFYFKYPDSRFRKFLLRNIFIKTVPTGNGFGMQIGLAHMRRTGIDKTFLANPFGFSIGFDGTIKHFFVSMNGFVGFNELQKQIINGSETWPKGRSSGYFFGGFEFGRRFAFHKHKIIPFIGYTGQQFSYDYKKEPKADYLTSLTSAYSLGFYYDYKMVDERPTYNDFGHLLGLDFNVRLKIAVSKNTSFSYGNFKTDGYGIHTQIGIGYLFLGQKIIRE